MTNVFKQTLGDIAGGRVLDVATQEGGFVRILAESLKSYTEIVGIDISEQAIETAQSTFDQENIQFIQMDAEQMDLEDESFDTVSISASLHHLANIPSVLTEMKRVLRLGGRFIIAEMHREGQTEAQLTVVYLHHWVAEVDSALGRLILFLSAKICVNLRPNKICQRSPSKPRPEPFVLGPKDQGPAEGLGRPTCSKIEMQP